MAETILSYLYYRYRTERRNSLSAPLRLMGDVAMSLGSVEHCPNEPDETLGRGWSALCR
jgi:hypothetical protein